jgi:hypothetical protein
MKTIVASTEQTLSEMEPLSAQLHDAEDSLFHAEMIFRKAGEQWLWRVIEAGRVLNAIRTSLKTDARWREWIENRESDNNPKRISVRTAYVYRQVANEYDISDEVQRSALIETGSIEAFLKAHRERKEIAAEANNREAIPVWSEAVDRFTKLLVFFDRQPLVQWPEKSRNILRSKFQPIATQLWPEKFQT